MKKIILISTVLVLTTVEASSQTVTFIEPRNVQIVQDVDFFTFKAGDNFYVLQKKYRMMAPLMFDIQLDAYDANRKPIGSNIIDKMLEMGDANIYHGIFPVKDNPVLFKSEYSKSSGTKMSYLWYYPLDATGKRLKKISLISLPVESASNSVNFGVNVSDDGSKIAVISELPFEKEGMEKCMVTLYDDNFKQLWKKDYSFAYESSRTPKNQIFVNNNGEVFILKQINLKKLFDKFSVFTFSNDGKMVTEKSLDLGNGFTIATYKQLFKSNGDLVLAGYSFMNKKVGVNVEKPDGMFYVDVNAANGELNVAKLQEMKPDYLAAVQLLLLPDNTVCLTSEHRSVASLPKPNMPGEYRNSYSYGNIYITKFAADGSQAWNYKFAKTMLSEDDGGRFIATYTWTDGNDVNLLFADYLSNHDDKKHLVEFGPKWGNIIQTIGADGKFKKEMVITDSRIGGKAGPYLFIPSTGSLYKDRKIFILAARGLELVGATITY
jgi:hypothetical protein